MQHSLGQRGLNGGRTFNPNGKAKALYSLLMSQRMRLGLNSRRAAQNSLFLILLSYCWGSAVLDTDGNEIELTYLQWLKVFRDIEWVWESMVKRLDQLLKHVRKEVESEPSWARKWYVSLTIHVLPL